MDARARGVEDEFADGNGHAARALIAQAEDAFVVGDDDEPDVALAEVAEALGDLSAVVGAEEQAAGAAIDMAVLLAGQADRGGVDDRAEALEVLDEQPVEEDFVAVQQGDQADVLFQRVALLEDVLQFHGDLLLDGEHGRGQETLDAKLAAFGAREGGVFVLRSVAKDLLAARPADVKGGFWVHGSNGKRCRCIRLLPAGMAASPLGSCQGARQTVYTLNLVLASLLTVGAGAATPGLSFPSLFLPGREGGEANLIRQIGLAPEGARGLISTR